MSVLLVNAVLHARYVVSVRYNNVCIGRGLHDNFAFVRQFE